MPELPEVEICARHLRRWIAGRRIHRVEAQGGPPLRGISAEALIAGLTGRIVDDVCRHGKQMWLPLDNGHSLLTHLGMTGKFVLGDGARRKGWRLAFDVGETYEILFVDPRRIGRVSLVDGAGLTSALAKLGPDALAHPTDLPQALGGSKAAIKGALLDQHKIAGVGNIYACEGLWAAGIDPRRACDQVSGPSLAILGREIAQAMEATLRREGDGEVIYMQEGADNPFSVYGRAGSPCPRCGAEIERMVQGGRSTFWCPPCQAAGGSTGEGGADPR